MQYFQSDYRDATLEPWVASHINCDGWSASPLAEQLHKRQPLTGIEKLEPPPISEARPTLESDVKSSMSNNPEPIKVFDVGQCMEMRLPHLNDQFL